MNIFLLYLILQLDVVLVFFVLATMGLGIGLLIVVVDPDEIPSRKRILKICIPIFIFINLGWMFIPTTKSALTLYAADYMTHNKKITKLTHDSLDLIANWVEKQKKEK